MELKYRVKVYTFPFADDFYVAQYKFLWRWWSISKGMKGSFFTTMYCYCENYGDATYRVILHRKNMIRASDWWSKITHIRYDHI